MKKLSFLLMAMLFSVMSFAETYSHTFAKNELTTSGGTVTLSDVTWSYPAVGYIGWDSNASNKGIQLGSGSAPAKDFTLSAIIPGEIQSITVNASTAKSATANLKVTVGDTEFINSALTTSATDYTGTGAASGEIKINFTQTTSKALYIKAITVVYNPNAGGPVKESVTLTWSAATVDAILGEEAELPTLSTTPADLAGVTYSSTNTAVATINATTGAVTLVGGGTTDIVASFAETDDYYAAEAKYTLTVLATTEDTWNLVTDASTLKVGDEVIIAAAEASVAMSTTQNSNNRGVALVVKGENTLTATNQVQVFTLEAGSSEGTFAFNTGAGYLWAASNSSNHLKTGDLLNEHASWTITIAEGVTSVVATNSTNRNVMQYNESSQLFSCYSSASQKPLALYKKYIEPVVVNHTITVSANPAEAGTVAGGGSFDENEEITVEAVANEGYEFVNWTVAGEEVSTDAEYTFSVTADLALVANFKEVVAEPEYEVIEDKITNFVFNVEAWPMVCYGGPSAEYGVEVYLVLTEDADGTLDYDQCSVSIQGQDVTFIDGTLSNIDPYTPSADAVLHVQMGEEYFELHLAMAGAAATVTEIVLIDAIVAINEDLGTLTFNVPTDEGEGYYAELASYTAPGVHEGPQICVFMTPEVAAFANYVETEVVDGVITLTGEFTTADGSAKFNVTISGKLPVVEPEVIAYELNGGELPTVTVPTQEELWNSFQTAAGLSLGTLENINAPVLNTISGNLNANNLTTVFGNQEWQWLKSYIKTTQDAQIGGSFVDANNITRSVLALEEEIPASGTGLINWRYAVAAFFVQGQYVGYPAASADFTEAGKPEVWGAAYQAAKGSVLPTEPVTEDYVLPTPTKEGYIFNGWYDNAAGTGEAYEVIPAGWSGTLYAIWTLDTTTALENIAVEGKAVKAIINGQLIIIKNGVQYNAQGAIVK